MLPLDYSFAGWLVALGIGLLIGIERERRKSDGPSRSPAGVRTFAIAAILGAVAIQVGGELLLSVATLSVAGLMALAYFRARSDDPGLTTEIALILTVVLGGAAIREPVLASGISVAVAMLLAARTPLHQFVRYGLTDQELNSALILAAATLLIWPILPDRYMGPLHAINPRNIWSVVILVMAVGGVGHIAIRALGTKYGLPLAGLASGFVSSTATIASLGTRAASDPADVAPAVAGAVLSTVATVIQLGLVVSVTSPATFLTLLTPLIMAGLTAVLYSLFFALRLPDPAPSKLKQQGEAFNWRAAILLGAMLGAVGVITAVLQNLSCLPTNVSPIYATRLTDFPQ